jgi:hypothetical protein
MLAEGELNTDRFDAARGMPPTADRRTLSTSPKGEVRPQAGVGAAAFSTCSSSRSQSSTSDIAAGAPAVPIAASYSFAASASASHAAAPPPSSNQKTQIQNPQSDDGPHVPARRQVPLIFDPIINDEANILCHIARGDLTLAELAIKYETTVSNFCLWLQREDIQQKLSDLTTCGAQLTRVAAVNQLPKAVQAMASQIDGYEFDRGHNLIKPGLAADKVAALRDANVRKAANLLLRLARFDPSRPLYSPRPPRSHALPSTSPKGEVAAQRPEGATAFSTCSASHPPSSLPTSEFQLPTSNSDLASLCSAALSAIANSRFADAASQVTEWRGNVREQPPQPVENLSETRDRSHPPSRSHSSTSDFPHPTSDIPPGRAPPRATSWL